jgi:large subunit ribosomal protein L24
MLIRTGDTVEVIAGNDRGQKSKVLKVDRSTGKAVVEGVNRVKKHTKVVNQGGRAGNTGGIVTAEAAIHISNVMVVDGKGITRLGSKRVETTKRRSDGSTYTAQRSVRVSRKSGEEI